MPKKNSLKVSTVQKEESGVERQKPLRKADAIDLKKKKPQQEEAEHLDSNGQPKKKKPKKTDEIDEIFASLKKQKAEREKAAKSDNTKDRPKKKRSRALTEGNAFNSNPKPRRRTNDGLVIYSEEDLGINKPNAGGTALCPFDCSCCF